MKSEIISKFWEGLKKSDDDKYWNIQTEIITVPGGTAIRASILRASTIRTTAHSEIFIIGNRNESEQMSKYEVQAIERAISLLPQ